MKKQYFINANIIDPYNSMNENGGLIISEDGKNIKTDLDKRIMGIGINQLKKIENLNKVYNVATATPFN